MIVKASRADTADILRLGERLRAIDYAAALHDRLSVRMPDDIGPLNHAAAYERLRGERSPAAAALRLFYLEGEESLRALRALLPSAEQGALAGAGVLAVRGARTRARMRVDAYRSLLLFADRRFRDPDWRGLGLPRGDMVYPPGSDSGMLADAVPERDGEHVLDLCTGSGIQALAVAARAADVVAVDIGQRAAALASVNAAFNGVRNVAVRRGDLYAPVRGQRFDLVLANPPFVPGPQRGPAYHSGGPRGDRVLRRVVQGLGPHLRSGGRAFIVSHVALRRGESVADAVTPWVRGFDGRVLAIVLETGTPIDLAAAQALFALDDGFAAYAGEMRKWVAYLQRHRIERIAALIIAAERTGRAALEVVEAFQRVLPLPLSQPPRSVIERWLSGN
jgi:carbamoyltransferase